MSDDTLKVINFITGIIVAVLVFFAWTASAYWIADRVSAGKAWGAIVWFGLTLSPTIPLWAWSLLALRRRARLSAIKDKFNS